MIGVRLCRFCKNTTEMILCPFSAHHIICYDANMSYSVQFSSIHSLSCVWLFVTPWTAAWQDSLSITNSWSLFKLMSITWWCHPTISSSIIPFSSCLPSFPASGSFPRSQFFASGGQSIEASASASVLPMNIQDWFPLELTDLLGVQESLKSLLQHHSSKA